MIGERRRDHDHEAPRGPLLVLELAAPLDEIPGGQLSRRRPSCCCASATKLPTSRPRTFVWTTSRRWPLSWLTASGPCDRADVGDARERHLLAAGGRQQELPDRAPGRRAPRPGSAPRRRTGAGRRGSRWRSRRRWPSPRARARPRRSGRTGPSVARSTSICTCAAPESTSTCRSAAPRTLSSTARISSPTRSRVAGVGPEHLDRHVRLDAGDDLVEAHGHGLGEVAGDPRHLGERCRHVLDQLLLRPAALPLVDGVEVHVDVALVDAHGLGGHVGTADLRDDLPHLGEAPDDLLDARRDGRRLLERDGRAACGSRPGSHPRRGAA